MDKFVIAHDLFLLFITLSQLKDSNHIIELFLDAVNSMDIGIELEYIPGEKCGDKQFETLSTRDTFFGNFCVKGNVKKIDPDFLAVIRNCVKMLAVLKENLDRERLLKKEHSLLEKRSKSVPQN